MIGDRSAGDDRSEGTDRRTDDDRPPARARPGERDRDADRDRRRRTVALADDERARVPFAVIGVLLLVTSSVIAGALQSRPEPQPNVDPSLAMDRTEAAAQTAVREAVVAATRRAAERPVTDPNRSNEYGQLLVDGPGDDVLENYLRMLIYLELAERLPDAGQAIRGTTTALSVPAAVDSATLEAGMERVEIDDAGEGVLSVAISGVRIAVERDGDRIADRTGSIDVSVATPLYQLHERVETYEERLNAGIDERGFGRRFNARTYALGWARGWAQYGGLPIAEVLANRHVVPAANSAAFATQEAVFGDAVDPAADDAMTRGWLCMAAQDAEELYGGYRSANEDALAGVGGEDLCGALDLVYGEQVGEADVDEPTVQDLLGRAPGMDETDTIEVGESAAIPLASVLADDGEHGLDSVVDRIFVVDVATDANVRVGDWTDPDPDPPDGDGDWTRIHDTGVEHVGTDVRDVDVRTRRGGASGRYARFRADVRNEHERTVTWRNESANRTVRETTSERRRVNLSVRATISEGEHGPDAKIDAVNGDAGIDLKYEVGDGGGDVRSINYVKAPEAAIEAVVGDDPERDFASLVERAVDVDHPADADAALDARVDGVTLDDELRPDGFDRLEELPTPLRVAIAEDLEAVRSDLADVSIEYERSELVHAGDEDGPVDDLLAAVEAKEREWLDGDRPYDSVGQKAIYEARYSYFQLLKGELERLADAHADAMAGLDDQLEDVNSGLGDATAFLRRGTTGGDPGPGELESPELGSEVTYEVEGSPTYLVADPVATDDVPAVENESEHAPLAARNENFLSIPYDSIVAGILSRIPLLGFGDDEDEVGLRVAGEALRAATLAEAVGGDSVDGTAELESEVQSELWQVSHDLASRVTVRLDLSTPSGGFVGRDDATEAVGDAVYETIQDEWTSPAERAIAVGRGEARDAIVESAATALDDPAHRPSEYDDRPELWRRAVQATAAAVIDDAVASATVQVDDVETLDEQVRDELAAVTDDVIAERLEDASFDLDDERYDEWLEGVDAPNRVPAGLPLTPVPGYWFATMNVWDVEVAGEYARFAVTANEGTPAAAGGTTYVRENATVAVEVDGRDRRVGATEPISFEGRSVVIVVVPPGGTGVGDRTGQRAECSETWPEYGPIDSSDDEDDDRDHGGGLPLNGSPATTAGDDSTSGC